MSVVFCLMLAAQLSGQRADLYDGLFEDSEGIQLPYCRPTKETLSKLISDEGRQRVYYQIANRELAKIRNEIDELRDLRLTDRDEKQRRAEKIKQLEEKSKEWVSYLGQPQKVLPTIPIDGVKTGMVGELFGVGLNHSRTKFIDSSYSAEIVQVLTDSTILISVSLPDGEFLGKTITFPKFGFFIEGIDTTDLVDGDTLDTLGVTFEVLGTRQYETVSGATSTVYVLKRFDMEPYMKSLTTYRKRQWTDATGKFSVEATFVESYKGRVYLRKDNGTVIELPVYKLSMVDRDWVDNEVKLLGR